MNSWFCLLILAIRAYLSRPKLQEHTMAKRHPRKAQVVFRVIRNRNQTNGTTLSFSFCEIDRITIGKREREKEREREREREREKERDRVVPVLNYNNKTKALVKGNLKYRVF